ncbi:MAG: hypothetical protein LBD51_09275 [Bifidobacteriaceae bacterium]|jgi:hypothetical protein|nr:hypothetical protein [Bifidobacteriaceae bacterium]
MGLPEGWVSDPALGLPAGRQLRALGNGVVPAQARLALAVLLDAARETRTGQTAQAVQGAPPPDGAA